MRRWPIYLGSALLTLLLMLQPAIPVAGQGHSPERAVSQMAVAAGLEVRLVAAEPDVRQPILVKMDDRGRLWTIQYIQYPNPAGLKRVKVDRWSRTVYDRVPKPPPHGPRGADRITILEDLDANGRANSFRDFVDGLNLATALAFGENGVYVLQVPYLLFYPDADHDDQPDSDPRVLLKGFGMQDAQSMANHLTWGPDGWLYGVNGSTTTCQIRGIEFQQGVWRYHPGKDKFELFCEGGGNTFGLTFNQHGELFYSTNGGPFIHALQGAYYRKSFTKHGPLHNPYTYGFFDKVDRDQVPGGPPTGGTIYLADNLPAAYRGRFIAGNFLGHGISSWLVEPSSSTFRASYQGEVLKANDSWFGATDVCLAADGSIYVCDFHDRRTAHPDPDADWDRSNGRIYQVRGSQAASIEPFDINKLSLDQLVDLLDHPNQWFADRARVHLAARGDKSIVPRLLQLATAADDDDLALEATWALHAVDGLDGQAATSLLEHTSAHVRRWVVRLCCDHGDLTATELKAIVARASQDHDLSVRRQLIVSARRLPASSARRILFPLFARNLDFEEARIPLLSWWAIESSALENPQQLVRYFSSEPSWSSSLLGGLRTNLVRRWAAAGKSEFYDCCADLLARTTTDRRQPLELAIIEGLEQRQQVADGIGQGGLYEQFSQLNLQSAPTDAPQVHDKIEGRLAAYIQARWKQDPAQPLAIRWALLADIPAAYTDLVERIQQTSQTDMLAQYLDLVGPYCQQDLIPHLLTLAVPQQDVKVSTQAISLLGKFNDPQIASHLLEHYGAFPTATQAGIRQILLGRPESALKLVQQVEGQKIAAKDVSAIELRIVALFKNDELNQLVEKLWGRVGPGTPDQKLATMRRFNNDLRNGSGDLVRGRLIYEKQCGSCHKLKGEGKQLGPDLTNENRDDRAALLANIVDPSSVVRRDYLSYVITTNSGQVLTGLLAKQDAAAVTLVDAKNNIQRIARTDIDSLAASPLSLMPDGILEKLTPQELCDLFSYLQMK